MSSVRDQPRPPTFFDLYSEGRVLPDEIDDFVDRWHEGGDTEARSLPLDEYLGLTLEEYELWVQAADILPLAVAARRESRSLQEAIDSYIDKLPMAATALDDGTARALKAWSAKR